MIGKKVFLSNEHRLDIFLSIDFLAAINHKPMEFIKKCQTIKIANVNWVL